MHVAISQEFVARLIAAKACNVQHW